MSLLGTGRAGGVSRIVAISDVCVPSFSCGAVPRAIPSTAPTWERITGTSVSSSLAAAGDPRRLSRATAAGSGAGLAPRACGSLASFAGNDAYGRRYREARGFHRSGGPFEPMARHPYPSTDLLAHLDGLRPAGDPLHLGPRRRSTRSSGTLRPERAGLQSRSTRRRCAFRRRSAATSISSWRAPLGRRTRSPRPTPRRPRRGDAHRPGFASPETFFPTGAPPRTST